MRKTFIRWKLFAAVTALCVEALTGCGQLGTGGEETEEVVRPADPEDVSISEETAVDEPSDATEDNGSASGSERISVLEGREPFDLLAQTWQEAEKATPAPALWNLTDYREELFQAPQGLKDPQDLTWTAKYRAVEGKDYYILARYDNYLEDTEEWESLYYLNHIDGDTLEAESRQLHLEELGLENSYWAASLDVADGRAVVFVQEQDAQSQMIGYYGVWFDQEGHVEDSCDLMPALEEARLIREDGYLWNDTAKWDARGYYCVRGNDDSGQYGIIDPEGKLAMVLDPLQGLEEAIVNLYHDSQGNCIWEAVSYKDLANVFWSIGEEQQTKLFQGEYQNVSGRVINAYGDLYYVNSNNILVRWDASTGKRENLYPGGGASFKEYRAALQNSRGDLLFFYDDGSRDYLYQIANEDVEQVKLTLACYGSFTDYYYNMYVSEFNRLHPGVQISLQVADSWDKQEDNWTRIQADLVAGKGPDLLMAPPAQLGVLQEKGLLMELSQVLDQETRQQLFPGVLEHGMINGGLYSVSHMANTSTLLVSKKLWPEDTWTWEEAMSLLEELEQAGQPVQSILNDPVHNVLTGNYLLCQFFLADLDHCSLLDLEEGKAYFDSEEFCRLLEVCKKYAQKESSIENSYTMDVELTAARKRLKEGEILCYRNIESSVSFWLFSQDLADLGEDYHLVGYPTEGESGNFLNCYDGTAVNAATEHADLAAEFLNYIVSRSCQESADTPVRRDVFSGRISESPDYVRPDSKPVVFLRNSQGGSIEVDAKPDGTSYLAEYLAFIDSCKSNAGVTDIIKDIIQEEAEVFFSSNRTASSVAHNIQSRVQLYLDENW